MTGKLVPCPAKPVATLRLISCRTHGEIGELLSRSIILSRAALAAEKPLGAVLPGLNTNFAPENLGRLLTVFRAWGESGTLCWRRFFERAAGIVQRQFSRSSSPHSALATSVRRWPVRRNVTWI